MPLKSVQALSDALTGVPSDAGIKNTFLAGFLEAEQRLPVPLAKFDPAAETFLAAVALPAETWTRFLGMLCDDLLADDQAEARMRSYFAREAAEFRKQFPPAPGEEAVLIGLPTSDEDMAAVERFLQAKKPIEDKPLGEIMMSWPVTLPGVPDRFQVELINCEGGPALVAYHFSGAKVVKSSRPQYHARAVIGEFEVRGTRYRVALKPHGGGA